jgi:RNA polymerase sigma-B factor
MAIGLSVGGRAAGGGGVGGVSDRVLFERWRERRDRVARDELVVRHMSLARKLAGRYARTQEPLEDLVQVACVGLIKAVDRFDPGRGAFSSFAVPTILGELKRHFRDKGHAVHLPRGLQELVLRVREADRVLRARSGCSPSAVEVAQYLGVELEGVVEALEAIVAGRVASLDEPLDLEGGESGTRHDAVGCCDDGFGLVELASSLGVAAGRLPALDRRVLGMRFGEDLKQREIAERIGVSQMQVSRILRRATDQMRDNIE